MSRWQWGGISVLIFCVIVMIAWDVIALSYGQRKSTLSYLLTMLAFYWPLGVFLLGAVFGHAFWPQCGYQCDALPERVITITIDTAGRTISRHEQIVERIP